MEAGASATFKAFKIPYNHIIHLLKGNRVIVFYLEKSAALVYELAGESTVGKKRILNFA